MKKLVMSAAIAAVSFSGATFAADNVGGCGWGSKVFDGKQGLAPQVLAVTSNNFYGTNTFGMTSGTSGCTSDGIVTSNWQTAMFIDGNKKSLARDMSQGQGETLESFAALIGVEETDKQSFFRFTQQNFDKIYTSQDVSAPKIRANILALLKDSSELSQYANTI